MMTVWSFTWQINSLSSTASRCRRAHILPLWFFLSFFRRLIPQVTERISTKLGHIFTYDCYVKHMVHTPGHLPTTGWGQETLFGTDLNFDRTYLTTEQSINNGKESCQSAGTFLHSRKIWFTLVQKRLRTVGEFLPTPPPALPHGRYTTDSRQTLARVYSLEQQNAGWAHVGLCHASYS